MELKSELRFLKKPKFRLLAFLLLIFQNLAERLEAIALEFCKKGNFPIRYFKATLTGLLST